MEKSRGAKPKVPKPKKRSKRNIDNDTELCEAFEKFGNDFKDSKENAPSKKKNDQNYENDIYFSMNSPYFNGTQLRELFRQFGPIKNFTCKGTYGFVSYQNENCTVPAIIGLNRKEIIPGKMLNVRYSNKCKKQTKSNSNDSLYFVIFSGRLDERMLLTLFSNYGTVKRHAFCYDLLHDQLKRYGYVSYLNLEDSRKAVKELHLKELVPGKKMLVRFCGQKFDHSDFVIMNRRCDEYFRLDLNELNDAFADKKSMVKHFSRFGCVLCGEMKSNGTGYVCYATEAEVKMAKRFNSKYCNIQQFIYRSFY